MLAPSGSAVAMLRQNQRLQGFSDRRLPINQDVRQVAS